MTLQLEKPARTQNAIAYCDTIETPLGPFSVAVDETGAVLAAAFGELGLQALGENLGPGAVAWRCFDLVEIGERMVERLSAERAAFGRVGLQRTGLVPQRCNLAPKLLDHPAISRAASAA